MLWPPSGQDCAPVVSVLWWDPSLLPTLPLTLAELLDLIVFVFPSLWTSSFLWDIGKRDHSKWWRLYSYGSLPAFVWVTHSTTTSKHCKVLPVSNIRVPWINGDYSSLCLLCHLLLDIFFSQLNWNPRVIVWSSLTEKYFLYSYKMRKLVHPKPAIRNSFKRKIT